MRIPLDLSIKVLLLTISVLAILAFTPRERINVQSEAGMLTQQSHAEPSLVVPSVTYDEYNIVDGYYVKESHKVKRAETFSDIMSAFNMSNESVSKLVALTEPHLNVRKIRAGNRYLTYHEHDSSQVPAFIVYEKDAIEYILFDLRDSLHVDSGRLPITSKQKRIQGTISSSLYQTLADLNTNPMLAIELSEIFAWQVDFYRIMNGDHFSVVYEEEFVGEKSIGIGKIIASSFFHDGEEYTAFPFEVDGRIEFYDQLGNSLRRPFLKAPLRFSRISSRYSLRRFHPVQKRYKAHLGTDYAAPRGTEVRSTADGVVVEAGYNRGNGRYVKIRHNSTYTTGYLHFSKIASGIKKGIRVKQGDVIGYVGSTGLATGPHLCYRFWKNGKQVDPLREKLPETIEPIREEYVDLFLSMVDRVNPVLRGESFYIPPPRPLVYQPLFDEVIRLE